MQADLAANFADSLNDTEEDEKDSKPEDLEGQIEELREEIDNENEFGNVPAGGEENVSAQELLAAEIADKENEIAGNEEA